MTQIRILALIVLPAFATLAQPTLDLPQALALAPIGTAFTYQGRLVRAGNPVNDTCDFQFDLWDALAGGVAVGSPQAAAIPVADGRFSTVLDFGVDAFTGSARWLEIAVQCPGDPVFTVLSPRVELTPAPYALALPGLYTREDPISPNIIGGYGGNIVDPDVIGATIAGGGRTDDGAGGVDYNRVTDDFGAVGGGKGNQAGQAIGSYNPFATVAGGFDNIASGYSSAIGGGGGNTATGTSSTVAGGGGNTAGAGNAAVGGGLTNTAGGFQSTVAGGLDNTAGGNRSTIGGGSHNIASNDEATVGGGENNTAAGQRSTVAGGSGNTASGPDSTIGGGIANSASGTFATVGGGWMNTASGFRSTVPGGHDCDAGGDASLAAGRGAKVRDAVQAGDLEGDEGTFVWADSSSGLFFTSTGPHQFLIRATGGVGIGTNSPTDPLTVAGTIRSTSGGFELPDNTIIDGAEDLGIGDGHSLDAADGSPADVVFVDNSGNVGVGTAIPSATLDVVGTTELNGAVTASANLTVDTTTLVLDATTNRVGIGTVAPANRLDVEGAMVVGTAYSGTNTAPTNGMLVQGNVGLGTTTPANRLDVEGGMVVGATYSGTNTAPTNGMLVQGNLGVGTNSPADRLHVVGDMRLDGTGITGFYLNGDDTGNVEIRIDNAGGVGIHSIFDDDSDAHALKFESGTNADLTFNTSGPNEKMRILSTGQVGIGTSTPVNRLDVEGGMVIGTSYSGTSTAPFNGLLVQGNVGIGTSSPADRLEVVQPANIVAVFNRTLADGTIISFEQDGLTEGTISVSGATVSYNAFTGSHFGWTDTPIERGTLVVLTGDNRAFHDRPQSEPVYGIRPSCRPNDPRCLGAYLGLMEPAQPASPDNPHQVMAVGNGDMWVIDTGKPILPGDYLISSDVVGHAMLDDPERFPIGYVIARAAESVVWATVSDAVEGRKHKKLSVFFESFERGSAVGLACLVEKQQIQIEDLQQRILRLESIALESQPAQASVMGHPLLPLAGVVLCGFFFLRVPNQTQRAAGFSPRGLGKSQGAAGFLARSAHGSRLMTKALCRTIVIDGRNQS